MPRKKRATTRTKRPTRRTLKRRPIKAMAIPRVGDILRGEPNIIQAAAANVLEMLRGSTELYNRERVGEGLRPIDYPGRRHAPKTVRRVAKVKARKPASRPAARSAASAPVRQATVEGLDGKPKTQLYRGNRMVTPRKRTGSGGARAY
jgi:hypothetical protein